MEDKINEYLINKYTCYYELEYYKIILNENFCKNLSTILNKEITLEKLFNSFINKIDLDILFNENNIDYHNIKYIILSMPKTGTHTLNAIFNKYYKTLSIHSSIELMYIDIRFCSYSLYDIINFISNNTNFDNINIISIYRNPKERYLSKYFHEVNVFNNTNLLLDNINIHNLYLFDSAKFDFDFFYNYLIKDAFKINLNNYDYNDEDGFCIVVLQKINWIFTKIEKINLFIENYQYIDNKIIYCDNISIKININNINIYNKNILFSNDVIDMINEREKDLLSFYKIL